MFRTKLFFNYPGLRPALDQLWPPRERDLDRVRAGRLHGEHRHRGVYDCTYTPYITRGFFLKKTFFKKVVEPVCSSLGLKWCPLTRLCEAKCATGFYDAEEEDRCVEIGRSNLAKLYVKGLKSASAKVS